MFRIHKLTTVSRILLLLSLSFILNSCASPNIMYRNGNITNCYANECEYSVIEKHKSKDENYDLAYVEFSERGNIFDREKLDSVITHIKNKAQEDNGVMVLVYAHGWRHNASNVSSGNVLKFRKLLKIISKNNISKRKIVGVYVGWRGLSLKVKPFTLLTYWGRKNTARQVGSGGVSELLLRLNKATENPQNPNKNIYVVSSHSFGGAVVLSAMKDILLERLVNTKKVSPEMCHTVRSYKNICANGCYKSRSFGDGLILVNPAVEANELLQIKELVSKERCYAQQQPKLLHILSTDSDFATNTAFKVGQFFGVSLMESETDLTRKLHNGVDKDARKKTIKLREYKLDTIAIGNYPPFRTGRSITLNEKEKTQTGQQKKRASRDFIPCHDSGKCVSAKDKHRNFPSSPFEPVSIIYTDSGFMKGHTDIFNENVVAYMAAAILDNQYKRDRKVPYEALREVCYSKYKNITRFNFSGCLSYFKKKYHPDFCSEFGRLCDMNKKLGSSKQ